jgi:hypothetical protein
MANVTNIESISNALLYPVSVRDGENANILFSIAAAGAWNGSMWAPWVGGQGEMSKSIVIECPDQGNLSISVFQDYWNPPNADAVKYSTNASYNGAAEIAGNNRGGGSKILYIQSDGSLSLQ